MEAIYALTQEHYLNKKMVHLHDSHPHSNEVPFMNLKPQTRPKEIDPEMPFLCTKTGVS